MKHFVIILAVLTTALQITSANAQTTSATNKIRPTRLMAKEGDTVWVFVNHVKADKREQFERFVHENFWPGAKKLRPADQHVFQQTRVLHPIQAEADGTYSYLFIMDPVVPGADYYIENLIRKMYEEKKANEYLKMFNETAAGPQTGYTVIQSRD